jgi:DNA (cytosine-5)-methyltransferase 1
VQADLEAEGYEVTPFLLPACGVNAVHRRDRIWFVAFKNSNKNGWGSKLRQSEPSEWEQWDIGSGDNERIQTDNGKTWDASDSNLYGCNECNCNNEINTSERGINAFGDINKSDVNGDASNSDGIGCDNRGDNWEERYICRNEGFTEKNKSEWNGWQRGTGEISSNASDPDGFGLRRQSNRIGNSRLIGKNSKGNNWQNFPTVSPICDGDDGISNRLDSITFPKWRNESIKAGGNAIVPQVVYQIFKAIDQYNQLNNQLTL